MSKRNHVNKTAVRLITLGIVFFAVVVLMLATYAFHERKVVKANVTQSILLTAATYSDRYNHDLERLKTPSMLVSALIQKNQRDDNTAQVTELLQQFCAYTDAYMAVFVDSTGRGISNLGERVDIGNDFVELGQGVVEVRYYYVEDDQVTGESALVITVPVNGRSNNLLAYYKLETLMKYNEMHDYDGIMWSSIIKLDGTVLYINGRGKSSLSIGDNLLDRIRTQVGEEGYAELDGHIGNLEECCLEADIGDSDTYVFFVPLGTNDWYFALGISDAYVSKMVESGFQTTKSMILLFAIACIAMTLIIYLYINNVHVKSRNADLQNKADTDLLTELNNKIATERKIKEYIDTSTEQQGLLFVFDIDDFKTINDTRGHAFGDEVLRSIGARMRKEFRSSDIVGRAGGDEFILFLKDVRDEKSIKKESERVAGLFRDFQVGQQNKYTVTASIGCAVYPQDAASFEELYKAADEGLYKAKRRGKNRLAFYRDENDDKK
ncbi:MAG: GGDEF domain-containing protein [Lachnospiraceae bacterium]|nr:GGDEF domain-containing protein [Lachnospiraceae bacterium]